MSSGAFDQPHIVPAIRSVARTVATRRHLAFAFELLIAFNALGLLMILVMGGADLGVVSFTRAEKPILILALAIPLRLALGERSLIAQRSQQLFWRQITAVRSFALERVPPAVVDVAFTLVATRTVTFAAGFVANLVLTPHRPRAFPMPFQYAKLAEIFADWDSGWYFDIASRGYYFNPSGQSSIAFFPLYPVLMRAVAWPFGGTDRSIWIAGIAISWIAFALAMLALHRLTERVFGSRETAQRTVLYLAVFPFSLFFTRVYAESVFLLTTVLAISGAYDGRWWRAGLWGALAALARPNGILIALPLVLMAADVGAPIGELAKRFTALLLVPIALLGYCGYVYTLSGDPLGWLSAQAHWGYSLGHPPWQQLLQMLGRIVRYGPYEYFFVSSMAPFRLFHGVAALLFLALIPATFKRLGIAMGVYVLVSLLVPLSGNALEGVGRYTAVLFPAFMVVGAVNSQRLREGIVIVSSVCLALLVCLFSTGRPVY